MFDAICIGLRIVLLLAVGLWIIAEYNEPAPPPPPITDQMRYDRGEIWWYENRDDLAAIKQKIAVYDTIRAANDTSAKRKLGCWCHTQKQRIKYVAVASVKSLSQFVIETYISRRDGPRPYWSLWMLFYILVSLLIIIGKLLWNRNLILETTSRWVKDTCNYIMPATPPPPELHTVPYVSDTTQIVLEQIKNAAPDVPAFWNLPADARPPLPTGSRRGEMLRGIIAPPVAANVAAGDNTLVDAAEFVGLGGNRTPSPRLSPRLSLPVSPQVQCRASAPQQAAPAVEASESTEERAWQGMIDLIAARVMYNLYRREQALNNDPPEQVAESPDAIPYDPVDRGIQRASNLSASRLAAAAAAAAATVARSNAFHGHHSGTGRDSPQSPSSPSTVQMSGLRTRMLPRSAGTDRRVGGPVN